MIQAIILEDDILSSWDYEMILDKLGISLIGTFKSWSQALPHIKTNLPDFMIIDLHLDHNENGIDFLDEMQEYYIPSILVSGFLNSDLIDLAIEKHVRAFVPKPLDKTTLTFHIKKLLVELQSENHHANHFVIKDDRKLIRIPHEEIVWIMIDGNYSEINLESGKKFVIKVSLKKVEAKLNQKKFFRCHRSSIINIDKVDSFDLNSNILTLTNNTKVSVGSKYKSEIKKQIKNK